MTFMGRYFHSLNRLKISTSIILGHSCRNYAAKKTWADSYRDSFNPQFPDPPYDFVCQTGDPVLRQKCDLVDEPLIGTPRFQALIDLMWKVHKEYHCVGLSAPQLGLPLQVIVIGCSEEVSKEANSVFVQPIPKKVLINPVLKISNYKSKVVAPEMCASMCSYTALVPRFSEVRVEALNEKGSKIAYDARGFEARIIQHEVDHLNGTLFTDKMDPKTLECTVWQRINMRKGKCQIQFKPVNKNSILNYVKLF